MLLTKKPLVTPYDIVPKASSSFSSYQRTSHRGEPFDIPKDYVSSPRYSSSASSKYPYPEVPRYPSPERVSYKPPNYNPNKYITPEYPNVPKYPRYNPPPDYPVNYPPNNPPPEISPPITPMITNPRDVLPPRFKDEFKQKKVIKVRFSDYGWKVTNKLPTFQSLFGRIPRP